MNGQIKTIKNWVRLIRPNEETNALFSYCYWYYLIASEATMQLIQVKSKKAKNTRKNLFTYKNELKLS